MGEFTRVRAGKGIPTRTYEDEKQSYGGFPDRLIDIPMAGSGGHFYGLNAQAILSWWAQTVPTDGRPGAFKRISTQDNCCSVVIRALKAGGGERFCAAPTTLFYNGINAVTRWATALAAEIGSRNRKLRDLERKELSKQTLAKNLTNGVWTQADWRNASWVYFGVRKEQVAAIDRLLPVYHAHAAKDELDEQATTLKKIQEQAYDHLLRKPTSTRRQAMLQLAVQVSTRLRMVEDTITEQANTW
jgi:hypothetical protein